MNEKNSIAIYCGACSLKLNEPSPKFSLMCACTKDLDWTLRCWAAQRGGKEPKDIIYSVYLSSDIHSYDGIEHMTCFIKIGVMQVEVVILQTMLFMHRH